MELIFLKSDFVSRNNLKVFELNKVGKTLWSLNQNGMGLSIVKKNKVI